MVATDADFGPVNRYIPTPKEQSMLLDLKVIDSQADLERILGFKIEKPIEGETSEAAIDRIFSSYYTKGLSIWDRPTGVYDVSIIVSKSVDSSSYVLSVRREEIGEFLALISKDEFNSFMKLVEGIPNKIRNEEKFPHENKDSILRLADSVMSNPDNKHFRTKGELIHFVGMLYMKQ